MTTISRLIARIGKLSVVREDQILASVPPFVVLDANARELERFARFEDATEYVATLEGFR